MNTNTTNSKTDSKSANVGADAGLQEKIMKQIRELGDTLERAGEKVEKNGWETIGQAISKLGDTLEHLQDPRKTASASTNQSNNQSGLGGKGFSDQEFDNKSKNSSDMKASVTKVGGNDSQAY